MPKQPVRPCIRGLKRFDKTGCPETVWDKRTGTGCPAWREYFHTKPGQDPVLRAADCIDCLAEFWGHEALKLLESNYTVMESLRNGTCEVGPDKKVRPKSNPSVDVLLALLKQTCRKKNSFLFAEENHSTGEPFRGIPNLRKDDDLSKLR